jgi:hypothetical protein
MLSWVASSAACEPTERPTRMTVNSSTISFS